MKQLISAVLTFLAIPAMLHAVEPEVSDTIAVIENAGNITITNSADGCTTIAVKDENEDKAFSYQFSSDRSDPDSDDRWNINLPFLQEKKHRDKCEFMICLNAYAGAAVATDKPDGLHGSIEFGLSDILRMSYAPTGRGFSINIGAGMGYRLYTLGAGNRFVFNRRHLYIEKAGDEMTGIKNRLSMFTFHIPLMLKQRIGKHFGISAGARLNFNTYAKASFACDVDGLHYKENYKGLHQKLMTVDFIGIIGFPKAVGIYASYSPSRPFDKGYGPDFKTISFGITLGF